MLYFVYLTFLEATTWYSHLIRDFFSMKGDSNHSHNPFQKIIDDKYRQDDLSPNFPILCLLPFSNSKLLYFVSLFDYVFFAMDHF